MVRALAIALFVLTFVPAAQAKGPFQVCGTSGCVELAPESQPAIRLSVAPGTPSLPAAKPAPYFTVRRGHGLAGVWVPGANALRIEYAGEWVAPLDAELALLQEKTAGLTPFAPPRHAVAYVDWERVRNGDGYLKLLTVGTPVDAAPNQVRLQAWVDVRVMGGTSPWNDGSVSLSIARSGYLLRAGHLFRISPKLASRVLKRLPLG
jgi:hypothetical protein